MNVSYEKLFKVYFEHKYFADGRWEAVEPVLKDPQEIYK